MPKELDRSKQIELVREYVKENFVKVGMCADIALHDKNGGNPHAHILLTMRPFNEDTTWGAKSKKEYIFDENGEKIKLKNGNYKTRKINTTDWNEQDKAEHWRKAWADIINKCLEENSIQEKVVIRKNSDNNNTNLEKYIESYQLLKEKNITSLSELKENILTLRDKNYKITRTLKDTEKQIDDKTKLIDQAEKYLKHKDTYKAYTKLKKSKQEDFYNEHTAEIILFESAKKYLKEHLGESKSLNISNWKSEVTALKKEKDSLYSQILEIREEVEQAEKVKTCIEQLQENLKELMQVKRNELEL